MLLIGSLPFATELVANKIRFVMVGDICSLLLWKAKTICILKNDNNVWLYSFGWMLRRTRITKNQNKNIKDNLVVVVPNSPFSWRQHLVPIRIGCFMICQLSLLVYLCPFLFGQTKRYRSINEFSIRGARLFRLSYQPLYVL